MNYNAILDVLLTDQGTEPVTLSEVKDYCRIDGNSSDAILTDMIVAARMQCEAFCNVSFILRTVTVTLKNELGGIDLPYCPLIAVTGMKDNTGTAIEVGTLTTDLLTGSDFPQLTKVYCDPVTITYTAGYTTLPIDLKNAVLAQVDWLFNFRGSDVESIAQAAKLRLLKYRRVI